MGPYEIVAAIGAGGMGEVYRARDTRLRREVAIKVLGARLQAKSDGHERLLQEARAVSALNHPNILALYDICSENGSAFLVMELVRGKRLDQLIGNRGLAVNEAIRYAIPIADALARAHAAGILHRDLKPSNIMIGEDGVPKILDFGLAQATASQDRDDACETRSLTGTSQQTVEGTAAYMSPEQAEGKKLDARSDIFSFGSVLYEMATGRRAFRGDSAASTLAAVLRHEPDPPSRLAPRIPKELERIVQRCLRKDPNRRFQTMGDVRVELEEVREESESGRLLDNAPDEREPHPAPRKIAQLLWVAAGLIVVLAALALWGWLRPGPPPPAIRVARIATSLPVRSVPGGLAISRDGSQIAFVSAEAPGQIYVRPIDQLTARPLAGTEGASFLCFSPDGEQIAFVQSTGGVWELKTVALPSDIVQNLTAVNPATGPPTVSWEDDGNILYSDNGVLAEIPAKGGKPTVIAKPDPDKEEVYYADAHRLPGSDQIITVLLNGTGYQTIALNPKTRATKVLLPAMGISQFIPGASPKTGYFVYYDRFAGALMATAFDAGRLEVHGEPVPVLQGISTYINSPYALMAISNSGTLIYAPGKTGEGANASLAWVDRNGAEQALGAPPRIYYAARVSPADPTRIAVEFLGDHGTDIWIYDDRRGTLDRMTYDGKSNGPIWTPDGQHIVYERTPTGGAAVLSVPSDHSGPPSVLTATGRGPIVPTSVSPDGKFVLGDYPLVSQLWSLPLSRAPDHNKPVSVLEPDFKGRDPNISPDGHWIAYVADDTGREEVYVTSYPRAGPRITISTATGRLPRWSHDGRELFYMQSFAIHHAAALDMTTKAIMSVDVQTTPQFRAGRPKELFEGPYIRYDPSPDGRRFLVVKYQTPSSQEASSRQVIIVFNWFEELRRRVGLAR